jgi:hypothetical protein
MNPQLGHRRDTSPEQVSSRAVVSRPPTALSIPAKASQLSCTRTKVSEKFEQRILDLAVGGMGKVKTAKTLGIGTSVVQRALGA